MNEHDSLPTPRDKYTETTLHALGRSTVWVCPICSAVVVDPDTHQRHHLVSHVGLFT